MHDVLGYYSPVWGETSCRGRRQDKNFPGNTEFLRARSVEVLLLNDAACIALMERFIRERPELWDEDIAGRTDV